MLTGLQRLGLVRHGAAGRARAWTAGKGQVGRGKELATVDRWLAIAILRVFGSATFGWVWQSADWFGTVGQDSARRGEAGTGEELETVDRTFSRVFLRVFGMTRLGMER